MVPVTTAAGQPKKGPRGNGRNAIRKRTASDPKPAAVDNPRAATADKEAERPVFGGEDTQHLGAGGAEGLQEHALAYPLPPAGRNRADEDDRPCGEAEQAHEADGDNHPRDEFLRRLQHLGEIRS